MNAPLWHVDPAALARAFVSRRVPRSEQWRTHFGRSLTPARIESAIRDAADGFLQDLTDAGAETILVDPHLASVLRKRFGAISQVDWDLTPAQADDLDKQTAADIASMVRSQLEQLPAFRQAIEDLAWGHWNGRAALENHWDRRFTGRARYQIAELGWIHPRRLTFGPERELRVIDPAQYMGQFQEIGLDTRVPCKFVRFVPRLFSEYPERDGLLPRCLYWSNFKRFAARDRMILIELYAKPWRIIEEDPNGTSDPTLFDEALDQADALGGVTVAKMPRGLKLRVEGLDPKSGDLHNVTIADCDKQISKIVLGSTGTMDAQPQGIGGQQARVNQDDQYLIFQSDGERISGVLQRDLVNAIVLLNAPFYGLSTYDALRYAPKFNLRTAPEKDRKAELEAMKAFVDLGIAIAVDEARERTGFRKPNDEEAIIQIVESPQDDMSARYIPPRAKVVDPTGTEPGIGEYGQPGGAAPPAPRKPDGSQPASPAGPAQRAALEPGSADEDFDLFAGPLGPTLAEIADLATPEPSGGLTNFPAVGENRRVSLVNSRFKVFPVSVARQLREEYPEIWSKGGTPLANLQFRKLAPIVDRRGVVETDAEEEAVRLREAWAARHVGDTDAAGVIAQIKWLVVGSQGIDRMLRVMGVEKARVREVAPAAAATARRLAKQRRREYQGIEIVIDRPRGFVQTGTAPDGTAWERTYAFDYGYIPRTEGGDGEDLDVFIGPNATSKDVFWIFQKDGTGKFDEYKVMLGFASEAEAKAAYIAHVPEQYFSAIAHTSIEMIKALLGLSPQEILLTLARQPITFATQPEYINGTTEDISDARTKRGAAITARWARALASATRDHDTAADIRTALRAAAKALDVRTLSTEIERCMLHSAALGALDADWEAANEEPIEPASFAVHLEGGQRGFTTRPFWEAINAFLSRDIVERSVWDRLVGAAKKKAFSIANLARRKMLQTAFDELGKSITAGKSLTNFSKALNERFESAGWTKLKPSHVETVFRNATMGAYSSGREVQMTQPAVLKARPYWQIRAVKDDRCRATHAKVRGFVLRADDPVWRKVGRPPWGHRCRCILSSRSEREIKRLGLTVRKGSEISGLPDPGWSSSKSALI